MPNPRIQNYNIFASFETRYARDANAYKAYDQTSGKIINCFYTQQSPQEVALRNNYHKGTPPSQDAYNTQASGQCDLTKYTEKDFPEIYDWLKREYEIFTNLYINNQGTGKNSTDMVPSYNGKTVSCSNAGSGYVPYVMEYELTPDYVKFVSFCITPSQYSKLSFSDFDHKLFQYTDSNTGKACTTNTCTTKYDSFLGQNLEPNPSYSSTPRKNQAQTLAIVFGVLGGLILIGVIAFILYQQGRRKKKEIKKAN